MSQSSTEKEKVCVCVCVRVCVCVHCVLVSYAYVCARMRLMWLPICMHTFMYMHVSVCTLVCMCVYVMLRLTHSVHRSKDDPVPSLLSAHGETLYQCNTSWTPHLNPFPWNQGESLLPFQHRMVYRPTTTNQ